MGEVCKHTLSKAVEQALGWVATKIGLFGIFLLFILRLVDEIQSIRDMQFAAEQASKLERKYVE